MSQMFTTDAARHLYAIDGGNATTPPKRKRALHHSTLTVVAVGAGEGVRKYDVVQRASFPSLCSEWEPA